MRLFRAAWPVEERKQSLTRIGISSSAFVLMIGINLVRDAELSTGVLRALALVLVHLTCALVWHRWALDHFHWRHRVFIMITADQVTLTLGIMLASSLGAFFFPIYLWSSVVNGLRFGKTALVATMSLAVVGFSSVLLVDPYWQANLVTGAGLLTSLVALPSAFFPVLSRMDGLYHRLEIELDRSQTAERAKGEFLANMSHEIRTPLNGVLGMAEVLADTELDDAQNEQVDIIVRSGVSLLRIINDILDYSKLDSGKIELEETDFDLRQVLDDAVGLLQGTAETKGLELSRECDPGRGWTYRGDPTRIRQIILNLVGNAIKFTREGSVRVVAEAPDSGDGFRITVRDSGVGIPEERQRAIFERFEQASSDTNRQHGGTGLGLAIARRLTRIMGGEIGLQSQPGRGSTFTVDLPLPRRMDGPAGDAAKTDLPDFGLRALVVEDNPVNQFVIVKLLNLIGVESVIAENGEVALQMLSPGRFDLVFMDLRMPVMDGLEATRAIRALDPPLCDIPIIALTADADRESAERSLAAGMNGHVAKPVRTEDLLASIRATLAGGEKSLPG